MSNIQIRNATLADTESVYRFVCELEDKIFDRDLFGKYYAENIANTGFFYLVATDNDIPVGYLSCHGQLLLHHMNYVYEIQELFVDATQRGKGIGKQLIAHLEELLADKDYDLLELASNLTRKEAHEFYLAIGFGKTHYKFTKPEGGR